MIKFIKIFFIFRFIFMRIICNRANIDHFRVYNIYLCLYTIYIACYVLNKQIKRIENEESKELLEVIELYYDKTT